MEQTHAGWIGDEIEIHQTDFLVKINPQLGDQKTESEVMFLKRMLGFHWLNIRIILLEALRSQE